MEALSLKLGGRSGASCPARSRATAQISRLIAHASKGILNHPRYAPCRRVRLTRAELTLLVGTETAVARCSLAIAESIARWRRPLATLRLRSRWAARQTISARLRHASILLRVSHLPGLRQRSRLSNQSCHRVIAGLAGNHWR